jgi:phosphatidylethanolamine/phosphatidyl-N-methylethanolamine N-methyltransferase
MGSVVPSSPALCRRVAAHAHCAPDEIVVELGAGTGMISRALLDSGLAPCQVVLVEIVPEMADHLRAALPRVQVITGDARELPALLRGTRAKVGAMICGVPLVLLPFVEQQRFVSAFRAVGPVCGSCITAPAPPPRSPRGGWGWRRGAWPGRG